MPDETQNYVAILEQAIQKLIGIDTDGGILGPRIVGPIDEAVAILRSGLPDGDYVPKWLEEPAEWDS